MLLAGCLSYSNSAMNPVLYAFLSENFKKSFLKACTCATGRDVNAALQVENSAFPRKRTLMGGSGHHGRGGRGGGGGGGGGGAVQNAAQEGAQKADAGLHEIRKYDGVGARGQARGCALATSSQELHDVSTGVTTTTSRSSRSYNENHSSSQEGSREVRVAAATTLNGNLAPPQIV